MSGSKTAIDHPEAVANRQLCSEINSRLLREYIHHWFTEFRIYADCSRGTNDDGSVSALGNNITDVDFFLVLPDGRRVPTFSVCGDRLHDPSVICNMEELNAVIDDPEGGNARMVEPDGTRVSVAHVLKNFGTYFNHLGVPEDTNMLGNFKNCTVRFQVHILELEVGQTIDDMKEGQLLMTAMNYHSRENEAKNVNLLFTTQGVSATTDASPPGAPVDLLLQGTSEDDGKLHNYCIGVEATKRMFSKTGQQSMEEKIEQVSRGRAAEMKLGPNIDEMPEMCAVMHMQVPCKSKPMKKGVIDPANLVAAAMAQMDPLDDEPALKYASLGVPIGMPEPACTAPCLSPGVVALIDTAGVVQGLPVAPPPTLADDMEAYDMLEEEEEEEEPRPVNRSLSAPAPCSMDETPCWRGGIPNTAVAAHEEDKGERYRGCSGLASSVSAAATRSLSSSSPARKMPRKTAPPPPPEETCRAASTHKGKDMGECGSINQTDLEPEDSGSSGIPTITFCIFMVKPKGVAFGTKDVKNAIGFAENVRKCAGEVHLRNAKAMKDAGATTNGITQQSAVEIAETFKALNRARKSNVPVCVN